MKGVMNKGIEGSFPRGWSLVVSREEGRIQRFQADGVDLIDPGAGEPRRALRAHGVNGNDWGRGFPEGLGGASSG